MFSIVLICLCTEIPEDRLQARFTSNERTEFIPLVHLLLGLVTAAGSYDNRGPDWEKTLVAWKRNPDAFAHIELDVEWTHPSEGHLIANFFQMALANSEDIARTLGHDNATNSRTGWPQLVNVLSKAVLGRDIGVVGNRRLLADRGDVAIFFAQWLLRTSGFQQTLGANPECDRRPR